MASYDRALEPATVPTWEVLASWFRPGVAAAIVALIAGFLFGRVVLSGGDTASIEMAMAPGEGSGGGGGLLAGVRAAEPAAAEFVVSSTVELRKKSSG